MQLKDATILLVDDEVGLLKIFKRWFEIEGCRVLTAENGVEALQVLASEPIDLIISDIRMPYMDGIELAKRVKKMTTYFPKIVFISGFSELGGCECCDLGIEFVLAKPILRETLLSAVRTCLTDRDALWREPPGRVAERGLNAVFESVGDAQALGLIAFGYGGFCIRSALSVRAGEAIGLNVEFTADRNALLGQSRVRWTTPGEQQIGVEITYINDENRGWLINLIEKNQPVSFIPRSSNIAANI